MNLSGGSIAAFGGSESSPSTPPRRTLSSASRIQKSGKLRNPIQKKFFSGVKITLEPFRAIVKAQRTRWVYEWEGEPAGSAESHNLLCSQFVLVCSPLPFSLVVVVFAFSNLELLALNLTLSSLTLSCFCILRCKFGRFARPALDLERRWETFGCAVPCLFQIPVSCCCCRSLW